MLKIVLVAPGLEQINALLANYLLDTFFYKIKLAYRQQEIALKIVQVKLTRKLLLLYVKNVVWPVLLVLARYLVIV